MEKVRLATRSSSCFGKRWTSFLLVQKDLQARHQYDSMLDWVNECRKVQRRHSLVEVNLQERDLIFSCRGFIPLPERNKLCQHLVLEGTRHREGMMASGVTSGTAIQQ